MPEREMQTHFLNKLHELRSQKQEYYKPRQAQDNPSADKLLQRAAQLDAAEEGTQPNQMVVKIGGDCEAEQVRSATLSNSALLSTYCSRPELGCRNKPAQGATLSLRSSQRVVSDSN